MLAYRRFDVRELNAAAHAFMEQNGKLGADRIVVPDGEELAAGDRILCRRNGRSLGLTNGTRGTVTHVDPRNGGLEIKTDRGHILQIPRPYIDADRVQLGYAMTGHAAQGLTVDRAYVLAPSGGAQREWGYVTLSRARKETHIYFAAPDLDLDVT